jgi:hypothetical protein
MSRLIREKRSGLWAGSNGWTGDPEDAVLVPDEHHTPATARFWFTETAKLTWIWKWPPNQLDLMPDPLADSRLPSDYAGPWFDIRLVSRLTGSYAGRYSFTLSKDEAPYTTMPFPDREAAMACDTKAALKGIRKAGCVWIKADSQLADLEIDAQPSRHGKKPC